MSRAGNRSLPAQPLADAVTRVLLRAGPTSDAAARTALYKRLGVHERRLYEWRTRPGMFVTMDVADRILSKSPYLWFDVWAECETHPQPAAGCVTCLGYYRARSMFAGGPLPRVCQVIPPKRKSRAQTPRPVEAAPVVPIRAPALTCVNPCCGEVLPRNARTYCAACRTVIAETRRTLTEGMWADDWALAEMADALEVSVAYFAGRRLRYGWDLPYRYERHAMAMAA